MFRRIVVGLGAVLVELNLQGRSQSTTAAAPLKAAAEAAVPDTLQLLKQMVDIDSGTGDVAGGNKVEDILIERLKGLGADVRRVPAEQAGLADNVVATLHGTGRGRILVVAHVDTVFGPGTAAKRPFRTEADRAYGPGVSDEKSGDACIVEALTILNKAHFENFGQITLLLDSSEEVGSPGARGLITSLAKEHDVELNMEPAVEPSSGATASGDSMTAWRKGSASVEIVVSGRAAHSGVAPQLGRNAAVELIHQLSVIDSMFPHTGDEVTVNLTLMQAGTRSNIIPDSAKATLNVRFRKASDFDAVLTKLEQQAKSVTVPDTSVAVTHAAAFPPLFQTAGVDGVVRTAQRIYGEIGRKLETTGSGGSSESALAQAAGIPAIDGLAFVGGEYHTDKEYVDLRTVAPRIYLTARLIEELGAHPPPREQSQ